MNLIIASTRSYPRMGTALNCSSYANGRALPKPREACPYKTTNSPSKTCLP